MNCHRREQLAFSKTMWYPATVSSMNCPRSSGKWSHSAANESPSPSLGLKSTQYSNGPAPRTADESAAQNAQGDASEHRPTAGPELLHVRNPWTRLASIYDDVWSLPADRRAAQTNRDAKRGWLCLNARVVSLWPPLRLVATLRTNAQRNLPHPLLGVEPKAAGAHVELDVSARNGV